MDQSLESIFGSETPGKKGTLSNVLLYYLTNIQSIGTNKQGKYLMLRKVVKNIQRN